MAKVRNLTEVEKFYIENNQEKTNEELSSVMSGIGPKSIEKYRGSIESKEVIKPETDTDHITQTREERLEELARSPEAGEFIAKQSGAAIMTQQASEITDARKAVQGTKMSKKEYDEAYKNKIHRPHG